MAALNPTPLATGAGTGATLDLTNVNPAGVGYVVVIATRMTDSGADSTPTISDSVDGGTGWTLIGTSRDPAASFNWAIRAWIKAAWSGNRTVTIGGPNTTYSVQAVALHGTAITGLGAGVWTTAASIGDGAETGTLSVAPASADLSVAVVGADATADAAPTWAGAYASLVARGAGAAGGGGFGVATRTASTATSVDVADSYTGGGTFFNALGLAFNLADAGGPVDYVGPPYLPFVVASGGAALTTNDPAVTFTGYVPQTNDLVALWVSSAAIGIDLVVDGSLPAGWFGLLGSGVDVASDAHSMTALYHFVTAAEADAITTTYTATNALAGAVTGYVQGVAIRNVDTTSPIDSAASTFSSVNTATPHVLAALVGANLLTNSLVVSSVARDATGAYAGGATGYTTLRADNTNNARWIGYGTALTVAGANWAAQNITPAAGDEYISITAAFTALHRPGRFTRRRHRGGLWVPHAARRGR